MSQRHPVFCTVLTICCCTLTNPYTCHPNHFTNNKYHNAANKSISIKIITQQQPHISLLAHEAHVLLTKEVRHMLHQDEQYHSNELNTTTRKLRLTLR